MHKRSRRGVSKISRDVPTLQPPPIRGSVYGPAVVPGYRYGHPGTV